MPDTRKCVHPHVFRMTIRDVYRCLGCGEPMRVIPYSEIAPDSTMSNIKIKVETRTEGTEHDSAA